MRSNRLPGSAALLAIALACAQPPASRTPRPDAGPADAGPPDAGRVDAGPPIVAPVGQWTWVPVPGSKCASGATAGIGINLAPQRDDLFIYLSGGGACWNQGTCVPSLLQYGPLCDYGTLCLVDAPGGTQPGASHVTEPDPYPADGGGAFPSDIATLSASAALDRSRPGNPFGQASYVFVPYCTGDLHAGAAERTWQYKYNLFDQPQDYTVHFAGAANLDAYLVRLRATFPDVRRVWLTGSSAGAFGATLNYERVQRAFPGAEVHLLADSGPLMQPSAHWPQWRDTWNLQLPAGCPDCDAGFPQVIDRLLTESPQRRIGLLSYDQDAIIAYYFFAPPGLSYATSPPLGPFADGLAGLEQRYDQSPNARYFVAPGTSHVLWGGYGATLADGGTSAPLPSRDGGTDLRSWIDAWATGSPGWNSWP